jgi:aryl-alcohol dehydrogenase-like predicted oxidoreductase
MEQNSRLGQSNLFVPRIGVGTLTWGQPKGLMWFNSSKLLYGPSHGKKEEQRAFDASLEAGVNFFDTAELYSNGASEHRVGELAKGKDAIIATKFPPTKSSGLDDFPAALKDSLTRLGRDYIDLFQVHFPSDELPIPQLMNLMADAVEAGFVRAVGVSNYPVDKMRMAHEVLAKRGIPLASNQIQYSLLHRKPEVDGILDACKELGITLIAYFPLGMGLLTGKYSSRMQVLGARILKDSFHQKAIQEVQPVIKLLREIGNRYDKSPAQVALRWLIENKNVLPIPGAKNSQQAIENAGALLFSLSSEEIESLNQATIVWK